MIKSISFKNYKAFKELSNLNFKPITILCGTNSCGKSSIMQSLLLLKQTMESQSPNQFLLLNGRFVHLGSFDNIIYRKDPNNQLEFSFSFSISREETKGRDFPFNLFFQDFFPIHDKKQKQEIRVQIKLTLKTFNEKKSRYIKPIIIDEWSLTAEASNCLKPAIHYNLKLRSEDEYIYHWENLEFNNSFLKTGNLIVKVKFANLFPISVEELKENNGAHKKEKVESSFVLRLFSELVQVFLGSLTYIGPLREEPSRRYIYEDEIVEIGIKGENAAYIYLSEKDTIIGNHYFYNQSDDTFKIKGRVKLSVAVKEWLNLMNIREFTPEAQNGIIYLNLDSGALKTRVNIADVGFGVSQIFPIVLEGLRMPKGNTLLLEQPEIHLHPKLQMQMADYFIALALSNKRVIVETHSDHVINRLVRRIVEDKQNKLNDLIGIYFIKPTDNGAIYEEIKIDETKGIANWPEEFFDQVAIEQEKILRAGIQKRMNLKTKEGFNS